ncbi:UNVERIFIED_CONTAM: hypothetical protein Slati_3508300 [Sesamum latifolium]|uniref:Integrase catalytic domain-containing protein n=1 Tax=Sesamum latifolium TaxID=2727402 RepID=A0AAW2UIE3_9LAMI
MADALSTFTAMVAGLKERNITVVIRDKISIEEGEVLQCVTEEKSWKNEPEGYLVRGIEADDPLAAKKSKFRANRFTMLNGKLYRRSIEGPLLKCLNPEKAHYVLRKIMKEAVVINREADHQHKKFGISRVLILDNGTQFQEKKIVVWCKELKIQQNFTALGNTQENWQTKVTNKILLQHLKIRLKGAKWSSIEELPGVLWAYRTTPRTTTRETPFCLVYGLEVVIPAEIGEETARIVQYEPEGNRPVRNFDLATIEEIRDRAFAKILYYKSLMMKSYNSKIKPRSFQVRDLVLKKVEVSKHVEKLDPSWEGPYKVIEVKKKGMYRLQDMKGKDLPRP